jgi:hypothetical protein
MYKALNTKYSLTIQDLYLIWLKGSYWNSEVRKGIIEESLLPWNLFAKDVRSLVNSDELDEWVQLQNDVYKDAQLEKLNESNKRTV